jgi:hypothetical protein
MLKERLQFGFSTEDEDRFHRACFYAIISHAHTGILLSVPFSISFILSVFSSFGFSRTLSGILSYSAFE